MPYTCPHCHRTSHGLHDEVERYCGACLLFGRDIPLYLNLARVQSAFDVVGVDKGIVYICDRTDREPSKRSVTNDAEAVVQFLRFTHRNHRIIYRDSLGSWDELEHAAGAFVGFKPSTAPQHLPEVMARAQP